MGLVIQSDAKLHVITVGSRVLKGFAKDKYTFEFDEDSFNTEVGSDGDTAQVAVNNANGKLTITLLANTPDNEYLSLLHNKNRLAIGSGNVPVSIVDTLGTTRMSSPVAWVTKLPSIGVGTDVKTIEWQIQCCSCEVNVGKQIGV
jgi:hypothetical protein